MRIPLTALSILITGCASTNSLPPQIPRQLPSMASCQPLPLLASDKVDDALDLLARFVPLYAECASLVGEHRDWHMRGK